MLTRLLCVAALTLGSGALAAADELELNEYVSREGKYKVLLPGEVKTNDVKAVEAKAEKKGDKKGAKKTDTPTTKVASAAVGPDRAFMVSYSDLAFVVPADQVKTIVADYARSLAGKDGKVLSQKDVKVGTDKRSGREVLIEKPKHFLRVRCLIVGRRLYQVVAAGPKDFVTSEDADKVIESFEVTK